MAQACGPVKIKYVLPVGRDSRERLPKLSLSWYVALMSEEKMQVVYPRPDLDAPRPKRGQPAAAAPLNPYSNTGGVRAAALRAGLKRMMIKRGAEMQSDPEFSMTLDFAHNLQLAAKSLPNSTQ